MCSGSADSEHLYRDILGNEPPGRKRPTAPTATATKPGTAAAAAVPKDVTKLKEQSSLSAEKRSSRDRDARLRVDRRASERETVDFREKRVSVCDT